MTNTRVVVCHGVLVVISHFRAIWLGRVDQQGGSIKGSSQAGGNSVLAAIARDGESSGAVAEDVCCRGLVIADASRRKGELAVRDFRRDITRGGLRVDRQSGVGVLRPDLVNVGIIEGTEQPAVQRDARVRGHGAEVGAVVRDDELVPACAVLGVLRLERRADGVESVGWEALHGFCFARCGLQRQGDGQRDKVYEGDVDVELC